MQREIKFRAWDTIQSKYHYGVECGIDLGVWMSFGNVLRDNRFLVEQFTGLHDKNGKEIYEGDIKLWKFNAHIRTYICYWSEIDCGFRWRMIKHNEKQDLDVIDIPFDTEEDYYDYVLKQNQRNNGFDSFSTLIGNIHENPELLK